MSYTPVLAPLPYFALIEEFKSLISPSLYFLPKDPEVKKLFTTSGALSDLSVT